MKYLKTFENYVNEDTQGLRDYSDPTSVNFLQMKSIPPSDKTNPDDIKNNSDFQKIQTEMQKLLLQPMIEYAKEHKQPIPDNNDAVQASDRFCTQIEEKSQDIMNIVKDCKGNYVKAAKQIIERFKKEIINNFYSQDSNPIQQGNSQQGSADMSRESNEDRSVKIEMVKAGLKKVTNMTLFLTKFGSSRVNNFSDELLDDVYNWMTQKGYIEK